MSLQPDVSMCLDHPGTGVHSHHTTRVLTGSGGVSQQPRLQQSVRFYCRSATSSYRSRISSGCAGKLIWLCCWATPTTIISCPLMTWLKGLLSLRKHYLSEMTWILISIVLGSIYILLCLHDSCHTNGETFCLSLKSKPITCYQHMVTGHRWIPTQRPVMRIWCFLWC